MRVVLGGCESDGTDHFLEVLSARLVGSHLAWRVGFGCALMSLDGSKGFQWSGDLF